LRNSVCATAVPIPHPPEGEDTRAGRAGCRVQGAGCRMQGAG
jgi:hypothetical protein